MKEITKIKRCIKNPTKENFDAIRVKKSYIMMVYGGTKKKIQIVNYLTLKECLDLYYSFCLDERGNIVKEQEGLVLNLKQQISSLITSFEGWCQIRPTLRGADLWNFCQKKLEEYDKTKEEWQDILSQYSLHHSIQLIVAKKIIEKTNAFGECVQLQALCEIDNSLQYVLADRMEKLATSTEEWTIIYAIFASSFPDEFSKKILYNAKRSCKKFADWDCILSVVNRKYEIGGNEDIEIIMKSAKTFEDNLILYNYIYDEYAPALEKKLVLKMKSLVFTPYHLAGIAFACSLEEISTLADKIDCSVEDWIIVYKEKYDVKLKDFYEKHILSFYKSFEDLKQLHQILPREFVREQMATTASTFEDWQWIIDNTKDHKLKLSAINAVIELCGK